MGRVLIPSSPTTLTGLFGSISKTPPKSFNLWFGFKLVHHKYRHLLPLACCFSVSSSTSSPSQCSVDISKYTEAFSRRMAMAGLKPHHRIGQLLFVSRLISYRKNESFLKNLAISSTWCVPILLLLCQHQT